MAAPMKPEDLAQLKAFVNSCIKNPELLHIPQLSFFRNYIESMGGKIPSPASSAEANEGPKASPPPTPAAEEEPKMEEPESEESDVELDNEGVIEAESEDMPEMFPVPENEEVSEEALEQSGEKRSEAMGALSEGNFAAAVDSFTAALKLNPGSAALYAKRANALLKQKRVKAAIQDCDRAISINPDSAVAHKLRGRAYRLLGQWLEAAKDLRLACKLDCDEQAMEWLAEVQPNATKLEDHQRKRERRKAEKELEARRERVRKAQKAQEEARKKAEEEAKAYGSRGMPDLDSMFAGMGGMGGGMPGGMGGGMPGGMGGGMPGGMGGGMPGGMGGGMPGGMGGGMPGGMGGGMPGGMPGGMGGGGGGMPDLSGLMSDPELLQAFTDPEISAAFKDVSSNPGNIFKYKNNPKVANVINKMMKKFGGAGSGMGGFPDFGEEGGDDDSAAPPPPPAASSAAAPEANDDLD